MRRWSDGTLVQVPYVKPGNAKPETVVRCVNDGREFPTIGAAAAAYGYAHSTVRHSIVNCKPTRGGLRFVRDVVVRAPKRIRDVRHDVIYEDEYAAGKACMLPPEAVRRAARTGRPLHGWLFEEVD